MCGICGEVTFDGSAAGKSIAAMAGQMRPRGPDAGGAFMQDRVAFGHCRLSIIDLAAASQQPVPALKYLRGVFLDFVRDVLDAPCVRQRGLFNRFYVERLLANPEGELTPKGHSKLWQIALLECWLQTQGI